MTVAYNQRTLPLSVNSSNTISSGIRLSYDFTGEGALAEGVPYVYQGATAPTLVKSGSISSVTLNGIPGRQVANGAQYTYSNATDYGVQFGTGDFTIAVFLSTASSLPSGNGSLQLLRIDNGGSTSALEINVLEYASNGWYASFTTNGGIGTGQTPIYYGVNKSIVFWIRRLSGQITTWTQEVGATTTPTLRNAAVASSYDFSSTNATRLWAALNIAGYTLGVNTNNITAWNRGLSDIEIRDASRDFWALDTNAVVGDSITLTTPSSGASISSTTTLSGTYVGTTPTGIEAQFGAGAWTALTGFSASAGSWSGSVVLTAGGPASLRVREVNNTAIVSADVTNITVQNNAIAFTVPSTTTDGAVPYRLFQRDGSNQASVRITGTYTGTPTSLEYSWNGGAWATLVASPSGGVFDSTVTLTGPGQGALSVRFSNSTGTSASLSTVGVGDIWLVAGQSNHQGQAAFTPATAPTSHPQWKAIEFSKQHVWREDTESSGNVFDDGTGAVYSAYTTGGPAGGTYFGALATVTMAAGVPIAIVPCAKGSTSIDNWSAATPSAGTLYGALLLTAQKIGSHKGVLWWQGEAEANGTGDATQWASKMSAIMDAWATAGQTSKWVLINPCQAAMGGAYATTVRSQIASLSGNANVITVVDLDSPSPAYSALHYATTIEVNTIASRVGNALNYTIPAATAITVTGPSTGTAGQDSSAFTVGANGSITGTIVVTITASSGTVTPGTVSISNSTPQGTFVCNSSTAGTVTLSFTNNGGLSNPTALSYVVSASTSIWDEVIEGGYTARQLMRLMAAVLLGKTSGMASNSPVFRAVTDTKNRVSASVTTNGDRTSITLDGS